MESHREGADPVSPKPRYQVLRAGVRIVADQFPPYDETPWEDSLTDLSTRFGIQMASIARQFGKTAQQLEANFKVFKGAQPVGLWADEASDPLIDLQKAAKAMEAQMKLPYSDHTPIQINLKNDGQTLKRPRHEDPFYVKLTKRKRR